MTTIVGVDPSLSGTGVARLFRGVISTDVLRPTPILEPPQPGTRQRKPRQRAPQTPAEQADRIIELDDAIRLWTKDADVIVIEGASRRSIGGLQEERYWLRGHVVTRARRNGVPLVIVPPSVLKVYATNNGLADKDAMLASAHQHFPDVEVEDDNAADALWLVAFSARRLGVTIDNVPATHERAYKRFVWPDFEAAA